MVQGESGFSKDDVVPMIWLVGALVWLAATLWAAAGWVFATSFQESAHVVVRSPAIEWRTVEAGTTLYIYQNGGEMKYYIGQFTLWDGSSDVYYVDIDQLIPGEEVTGMDDEGNLWAVFLPSEYERTPYVRVIWAAMALVAVAVVLLRIRRRRH